jgi:hypothetical protein
LELLEINNNTTLHPPDEHGNVSIELWADSDGWNGATVSFKKLSAWVASIREQIITSSNEQAKELKCSTTCGMRLAGACSESCDFYPPAT